MKPTSETAELVAFRLPRSLGQRVRKLKNPHELATQLLHQAWTHAATYDPADINNFFSGKKHQGNGSMNWKDAIHQWRLLSPEQKREIRRRRLPRKVARSMAFSGDPVSQQMLKNALDRKVWEERRRR